LNEEAISGLETISVDGKEIGLRVPPNVTEWYYQHRDNCTRQGEVMRVPYAKGFIEHCVVKPSDLTINDFSIQGLGEFVGKVDNFLITNS